MPWERRAKIANSRRAAAAVARGELKIAGALLHWSVEIIVARKARLLRRFDELFAQGVRLASIRDAEWAAHAVQRVLAALLVFRAAEIWKHILEKSPGVADLS